MLNGANDTLARPSGGRRLRPFSDASHFRPGRSTAAYGSSAPIRAIHDRLFLPHSTQTVVPRTFSRQSRFLVRITSTPGRTTVPLGLSRARPRNGWDPHPERENQCVPKFAVLGLPELVVSGLWTILLLLRLIFQKIQHENPIPLGPLPLSTYVNGRTQSFARLPVERGAV